MTRLANVLHRRSARVPAWGLLCGLLLGSPVLAQPTPAPLEIDDLHPERSIPTPEATRRDPMLMSDVVMEISARAEKSEASGAFSQAARYHEALAIAVPTRATAFARACRAHAQAGETDAALDACRKAMGKAGVTLDDSTFYVQLLLATDGPLPNSSVDDIDALLGHLDAELHEDVAASIVVAELRCQLAARLEDLTRLERCSARLSELAPQDPRSFAYAAISALKKGDFPQVERLIAGARNSGYPSSAITLMDQKLAEQRTLAEARSQDARSRVIWLVLIACTALAMAATWLYHRRPVRRIA